MTNTKFKYPAYIISIVLIASSFLLTGCSEYKIFTLEKGIAHFAFECPYSYKTEKVEVRSDFEYTHIILSGPGVRLIEGGMDRTFIYLFIRTTSNDVPSAESALEDELTFKSGLPLKDYQLMERSQISVAGIDGEQLIYYWDMGVPEYPDDPEPEPIPTIMRKVYFDYGNLIWTLSIRSNQAIVEEANAIFEHILETFKILD
jgi:hypothetical protein